MPKPMYSDRNPSSQVSGHRHAPSRDTNASGIADSTISFDTLVTDESLRLSRFPDPPTEIPPSPIRTGFSTPSGPSPTRSNFTITPPVTPQSTRTTFQLSPVVTSPLVPHRKKIPNASAGIAHASASARPPYLSSPPNSLPAPSRSLPPASYTSPPSTSSKFRRPPPLDGFQRRVISPHPSPSSLSTLSPYDWHEGASSIVVDASEDRLLSTSFITSLLSSSEGTSEENSATHSTNRREQTSRTQQHDDAASVVASVVSEMTYPPLRFMRSPLPEYPSDSRITSASSMSPIPPEPIDHSRSSRPPPSSFVPVESGSRLTAVSSRTSGDSETLLSPGDNSHASAARIFTTGFGIRGVSAAGVAPATLQEMSTDGRVDAPLNKFRPSVSSSAPGRSDGTRGSANFPDYDLDAEKLGMSDFKLGSSSMIYGSALPSTAGSQTRFIRDSSHARRDTRYSMRSTKSYVPSFLSRLSSSSGSKSAKSIKQAFNRLRRKPLPPVPTLPHIPISVEAEHRKIESDIPLPELASRAGKLSNMLERGYHPHMSLNSWYVSDGGRFYVKGEENTTAVRTIGEHRRYAAIATHANELRSIPRGHKSDSGDNDRQESWTAPLDSPKIKHHPMSKKQKRIVAVIVLFVVVLIIVGVVVATTVNRRRHNTPICPGNFTGAACNLDATCTCTSSLPGQCDGLAQSLVSLTPTLNTLFSMNFTANSLSTAIWLAQGAPVGENCAIQSRLVDVAPALDSNKFPNRTQWAQSALLWNVVQSQDLPAVQKLQQFILDAPWEKLGDADGRVSDPSSAFSTTAFGYTFDFAAQTATQIQVSFVSNGEPTSAQIAQVGLTAESALDRMYSFALASSTQQQTAMATYWKSVLQQTPEDMAAFLSAISSSPILIPFDATSSPGSNSLAALLTNSSNSPFPPPLACYPGLDATQIQRINTIENSVFGLSSITAATQFDPSCYPDHPLYGVLDVLQLRLPFIDSRTGVAKQAAVLSRDVAPRAVIYSGERLSALPSTSAIFNATATYSDPRQYGTLNHLNHVILNYLSSIPDINTATALVKFVLSSQAVPPTNTTILPQSLASIPVLEVAIFGTINPSDISSAVSSFSTPSGSLFFGSDQALSLREWAVQGAASSIAWTEFAISPQVVHDSSFTNAVFNSVWNPASLSLQTNETAAVSTITASFQELGEFSP